MQARKKLLEKIQKEEEFRWIWNKGYLQLSTTWYGDVCLKKLGREEEIRFGFYEPNGNTAGEMIMIWEKAKDEVLTKLVVFGDSGLL